MEKDEKSAVAVTVEALVGLGEWQAWIDARPNKDSRYLTLAIRCMTDDLTLDDVRQLTTWCLAVERRKANNECQGMCGL